MCPRFVSDAHEVRTAECSASGDPRSTAARARGAPDAGVSQPERLQNTSYGIAYICKQGDCVWIGSRRGDVLRLTGETSLLHVCVLLLYSVQYREFQPFIHQFT